MVAMRDIGVATDTPKSPQREPIAALRTIGDYQIIREIGRGGMGVVYEATQISLDRRVGSRFCRYAAMLDQRALQRFRNEATAAAKLNHPNVVDIYGVACDRGVHHYAMRMVDGLTMADVIRHLRIRRDRSEGFPSSISSMHSELSHAGDAPPPTSPPDEPAHRWIWVALSPTAKRTRFKRRKSMRMIHQPPEHFLRWPNSCRPSPMGWNTPISKGWSTETSNRPTCCSTQVADLGSRISDWPRSRRERR